MFIYTVPLKAQMFLCILVSGFNVTFKKKPYITIHKNIYRCASVFTGNRFQDLPRLRKTADNTESYI
jgi:hypothetical protein